jgi:Glycosyl hydrolase family 20, catalytic domain/Glycosyl hydrolase family 20, domain 2/NPCBM-associated, NEW3 domain of alpha-galactosidase
MRFTRTVGVGLAAALLASTAAQAAELSTIDGLQDGGEVAAGTPNVVPALREWSAGSGAFRLGAGSRIVTDSSSLADEADQLRNDLAAVTGLTPRVVMKERPESGDLFLTARAADAQLGSEGYRLEIGDRIQILAGADAGVFYGTQTVLQMLRSTAGHRTLPRGAARDWPRFRERGYMLDAGRKYWSPDYIVQTIREMAYLKLNTLQLHLSDNNAFRLVSDRFPYLAAPEAYTKADIRRFEAAARKYHVTIIPEIEMPAHAGAILKVRPDLGLDCQTFGTTLDVTRREVRDFTRALIDEFAPLFSGPEFHIATDEYPGPSHQQNCEPLVRYAEARGFGSTADVFVDFINEMNTVVRSHGKQTVIWSWWDVDQDPTIAPDKNIKVETWTTEGTGGGHGPPGFDPQHYLDLGYEVVASPSDKLYVTPGLRLLPNPRFLYEEWEPLEHPRLDGYLISVWADSAITQPDSSFDTHLRRPREAMADRVWGGPRRGTIADLIARADAIGSPPRVPENALPGTLTGTPYGTSPAWGNLPNTYDKVFDGDPSTFFDFAEPSGGYTGIDLGAGHASPVAAIRFVPRNGQLGRVIGGRFEGCTDGPTAGCRTLATVTDGPMLGWNELAVVDTGQYRWLRYVGPDGSFCDVAEIEFVARARDVTVEAPARLRQLDDNRVVTTYRNTSSRPVYDVRLDLIAYAVADRAARVVQPSAPARFPVVQPGATVSTPWRVDVPLSAATGAYDLVGRASYQQPGVGRALEQAGGFSRSMLGPPLSATFDKEFVDLEAGDSEDAKLQITNNAARAVTVGWTYNPPPTANSGFALAPAHGTLTIPAGDTASAILTASASEDASGASPSPARVDVTAAPAGTPETRAGSLELKVLWYPGAAPSLAVTYNNQGISDDNNPTAGSFDGGEASYSAQGLAAAGLSPGATVTHDALTFTWPDTSPGEPDNTATDGQVIAASGSGTKLGLLGAACCAPTGGQSGTAFITYDDGSVVRALLAFADWWTNTPLPGTEILVTVPWNVPPENPDQNHPVSVYYTALPLDPSKTVRFVTFPTNLDLHVFALAIGGS